MPAWAPFRSAYAGAARSGRRASLFHRRREARPLSVELLMDSDLTAQALANQELRATPVAWRQPQVTAMGQSDPLPCTPHGRWSVRRQRFGVNPPGLGSVEDECSFLAWGLRTRLQHAAPFGSWLQGPEVNLQWGHTTVRL